VQLLPPAVEQAPPGWAQPPPGWAQPPPGWAQSAGYVVARQAGNGQAVASLVLGITSIVFCWWGLATLAQVVLAIVLGSIGISRAKTGATGKNLAVAGLICGCVGAAFYVFFGLVTLGVGFIV